MWSMTCYKNKQDSYHMKPVPKRVYCPTYIFPYQKHTGVWPLQYKGKHSGNSKISRISQHRIEGLLSGEHKNW